MSKVYTFLLSALVLLNTLGVVVAASIPEIAARQGENNADFLAPRLTSTDERADTAFL
ncbi:hypothetical protein BJ165DRAFT_1527904 [Panaeolus papilionaceus]|nr:hypothetical protein BJ165DRAFT_1527904 [Panaeolus papilionaceus]